MYILFVFAKIFIQQKKKASVLSYCYCWIPTSLYLHTSYILLVLQCLHTDLISKKYLIYLLYSIVKKVLKVLTYRMKLYWLLSKNINVNTALFIYSSVWIYNFIYNGGMTRIHSKHETGGVRWDFLAPMKTAENPVWYARITG